MGDGEVLFDADEVEREYRFGLRLATAAQLMQGMLANNDRLDHKLVDRSVEWANKLIGRCKEKQDVVVLTVPFPSHCPDKNGSALHMQQLLQSQGYGSNYEIR